MFITSRNLTNNSLQSMNCLQKGLSIGAGDIKHNWKQELLKYMTLSWCYIVQVTISTNTNTCNNSVGWYQALGFHQMHSWCLSRAQKNERGLVPVSNIAVKRGSHMPDYSNQWDTAFKTREEEAKDQLHAWKNFFNRNLLAFMEILAPAPTSNPGFWQII